LKITMIALGSTGDVRPYILLGRELKSRGHQITIACFDSFRETLEKEGLGYAPITGNVVEMMANIMKPGTSGVKYLSQVEKTIREIAPVLLKDLMRACEDADALICTFFGSMYYSIAEKYQIPCIQTHYFPMDPNSSMPISSAPFQRLGKAWNKASYKIGYLLIGILEKWYLTDWRKENGMPLRKVHTHPDYVCGGHTVPVIYATSPQVMPRPAEWNDHIHMSGFWYDDMPIDYTPSPELEAFLAAGEKPVYIGFGSMVSGNMNKTMTKVLRAVKAAKVRAIIATGWADNSHMKGNDNVFFVEYLPHDWLFPRVSAVVHHGGAGTTAAGLRYGRPTLVIPFGGDQPFWGNQVHKLGCGPRPISRDALTVVRLTRALIDLTSRPRYRAAARALADSMRQECGVVRAADIVEMEIAAWNQQTEASQKEEGAS